MNTLISTPASSLNTYTLPSDMVQILSQCVEDIENGNKSKFMEKNAHNIVQSGSFRMNQSDTNTADK